MHDEHEAVLVDPPVQLVHEEPVDPPVQDVHVPVEPPVHAVQTRPVDAPVQAVQVAAVDVEPPVHSVQPSLSPPQLASRDTAPMPPR